MREKLHSQRETVISLPT